MYVAHEALYHVLAFDIEVIPPFVPKSLEIDKPTVNVDANLEQVCTSVVNPLTNKTTISYKKVINCPALCAVWMKAMCKELGNIA